MEVLDLSDETAKINTDGYLIARLYAAAVAADETIYKFLSESFKKLFVRLQRGDVFT